MLDFTAYVRAPRISSTSGVILAIRLILAAPKDLDAGELEALEALREAALAVQRSVSARHRRAPSSLRPLDRRFDGAWAGLHGRLVSWTRLHDTTQAERAAALLATVFVEGLAFTNHGYEAQWLHSDMLLRRIDDEGLAAEIDSLAHPKFLAKVREHHTGLGVGLGLLEAPDAQLEPAQLDGVVAVGSAVTALAEAIADYSRILAGRVKTKDPASVARFEAALAPLDAHRLANRRTVEGGEEIEGELDVDSPIPELS